MGDMNCILFLRFCLYTVGCLWSHVGDTGSVAGEGVGDSPPRPGVMWVVPDVVV